MRRALFLSLLMLGFVAAVPRVQADPVCTTLSRTTRAGSVNAQVCFDAATGTIKAAGTLTLPDGTIYNLNASGAITMAIVNGKPVFTLQADVVVTDAGGAIVWETHLALTSSSLSSLLFKFSSTLANLPAAL